MNGIGGQKNLNGLPYIVGQWKLLLKSLLQNLINVSFHISLLGKLKIGPGIVLSSRFKS